MRFYSWIESGKRLQKLLQNIPLVLPRHMFIALTQWVTRLIEVLALCDLSMDLTRLAVRNWLLQMTRGKVPLSQFDSQANSLTWEQAAFKTRLLRLFFFFFFLSCYCLWTTFPCPEKSVLSVPIFFCPSCFFPWVTIPIRWSAFSICNYYRAAPTLFMFNSGSSVLACFLMLEAFHRY